MELTVACTATLRPELLKRTLESFERNLFGPQISNTSLVMNVDIVGHQTPADGERRIQDVIRVIDSYQWKSKDVTFTHDPHFGKAFCRVMRKVQTEFVFFLEEDWELVEQRSFSHMVGFMEGDLTLVHIRLSAFPSVEGSLKTWNKFMYYRGNDLFTVPYEMRQGLGWSGHPSLNRTSWMKRVLELMVPERNPEKQIKGGRGRLTPMGALLQNHKFGIYQPAGAPAAIRDIGREWMVEHGFAKQGNKAFFTNWVKQTN